MKTMIRHAALGLGLLLMASPLAQAAPTDDQIKRAISDASSYLKTSFRNGQGSGATKLGGGAGLYGAAELAAIALLEAGVPLNDPAIMAIAAKARGAALEESQTYNMALTILLLDKLEDPADVPMIQALGIRLLAGQAPNGGWTYSCPQLTSEEITRLRNAAANAGKNQPKKDSPEASGGAAKRPDLSKEAEDIKARLVNNMNPGASFAPNGQNDDNSNTQFAVLGLWTARRYGVPVEKALALTEERFRKGQAANGAWGYMAIDSNGTASMTCAGLLALAAGRGMHVEHQRTMRAGGGQNDSNPPKPGKENPKGALPPAFNPKSDPGIVAGLNFVGNEIAKDMAGRNPFMPPGVNPANLPPQAMQMFNSQIMHNDFYCLWSIERVGMIFGEPRMGNNDWYAWGSTHLVKNQFKDGSWTNGKYGPDIDTSFALMFLCRANLVKDMSGLMGRVMRVGGVHTPKPGTEAASNDAPKVGNPTSPTTITPAENEAQKLAKALVEADGAKQTEMIKEYAAAKGAAYTDAFVVAIPQLPESTKKIARDSFAERMSRMSANTLKSRLQDESPEMRRAAVLAVAMREERGLIPDLITALEDSNELVWRAARLALKSLSDKDFGPAPGAAAAERAKAIAAWREWAKTQK
ncbi:MAG TPA: hypothetical protein VGZ47_01165 [Gemmataceae bacterium]|nr:hypothetical protein [Gemmataceae bacterium]